MKHLNKQAASVFQKLLKIMMESGGYAKIDNSESFMAVIVEAVSPSAFGLEVSVAHYYEQNGDLMADPEIVFVVTEAKGDVYPKSFTQHNLGIYQEVITIKDGEPEINVRRQWEITEFANQWMLNIEEQQFQHETVTA